MNFFAPKVAAHTPHGLNTSGRKNVPVALLEQERAKPANCFRLDWKGEVTEGILCDFNHPNNNFQMSFVLGEGFHYLKVDDRNPCWYEEQHGRAFVRRADLQSFDYKDKPYTNLVRLEKEIITFGLLHLDLAPKGARIKQPLYAGWGNKANVLVCSEKDQEALVRVDALDEFDVFFANGHIAHVTFEAEMRRVCLTYLSIDEIVEKRLAVVQARLDQASTLSHDSNMKAINFWFYQLANMIRLTAQFPQTRKQIVRFVGAQVKAFFGGKLSASMHRNFFQALKSVGEMEMPWWMKNEEASFFSMIDYLGATERRGPPREALARRATRANADRKATFDKKGPSNKTEPNRGGKQKGGKKK